MISHLTPCFIWWPLLDLNQRPSDYECQIYDLPMITFRYFSAI